MKILYIDTASTTGIWNWREPEQSPAQPHMIRVAVVLTDDDPNVEIDSVCWLVEPLPGWPAIPSAGMALHNIDQTDLHTHGVKLPMVTNLLTRLIDAADLIVAHNASFHTRVVNRAFRDAGLTPPVMPPWFCTMQKGADVVRVTLQGNGRWKWPSLVEAYHHFAGEAISLAADPHLRGMAIVRAVQLVHEGIAAASAKPQGNRAQGGAL